MSFEKPYEAIVCLATFKRPAMLINTLHSLLNQINSPYFTVYIVENDAMGLEGFQAASAFILENNLPWKVLIEPQQGNVHAINAVFTKAMAENPICKFFLMIDDDEEASPDWLHHMVANASMADIIGGPVYPRFARETKAHKHPAYHPAFNKTGAVSQIYGSGNCLFSREILQEFMPFDVAFNHLGGADSDIFTRARLASKKFYWVEEAKIYESVPEERLSLKWLLARGLRIGALNVLIEQKRMSRFKIFMKNITCLFTNFARASLLGDFCPLSTSSPSHIRGRDEISLPL
jgi:glycosyltransferase involved in cell wall biosynthesis